METFDVKYYQQLWNYIEKKSYGEHPIRQVDEEKRTKFMDYVKYFIDQDEFRPMGFFVEFSSDYQSIIKKKYWRWV